MAGNSRIVMRSQSPGRWAATGFACLVIGVAFGSRLTLGDWTLKPDPRVSAASKPAPTTAAAIKARQSDLFYFKTPLKLSFFRKDREIAAPLTHSRYAFSHSVFESGWDLIDLGQGVRIRDGRGKVSLNFVQLSSDGETIMGLNHNGAIDFESLRTGKLVSTVIDSQGRLNKPAPLGFIDHNKALISNSVGGGRSLDVVDVATGKIVLRAAVAGVLEKLVLSPNGRYAAFTDASKLVIADLQQVAPPTEIALEYSSELVGEHLQGIAFSPNGSEITVLFNRNEMYRFLSFDMATGKKTLNEILKTSARVSAPPDNGLAYLPDSSGWVVDGRWVIDATELQVTGEFPANKKTVERWVVSAGEMLVADKYKDHIEFNSIAAQPVAASLANERDFDVAARRTWTLKPIAQKPAPPSVTRPLVLGDTASGDNKGGFPPQIRQFFAGGSTTLAAVSLGRENWNLRTDFQLVRFDPSSGKILGSSAFMASDTVLDISPDGKQIAVWKSAPQEAGLVMLDMQTGKQEAQTLKLPLAHEQMVGGAFLADGRLLIQTDKHLFCIKNLSQIEWTASGSFDALPFLMTPDRKLAIISTSQGLMFFDPASGEKINRLRLAAGLRLASFQFSPQGDQFAVICSKQEDVAPTLLIYDLGKGTLLSETIIPGAAMNSTVSFPAPGYFLFSYDTRHWLFSTEKKQIVWQYAGAILLTGPAPSSAWLLFALPGEKDSCGALVPLNLPHKAALDRAAKLTAADLVWKPGSKVMIDLTTVSGQDHQKVMDNCHKELKGRGIEVVDKSDNVLKAACYLKVGETQTYKDAHSDTSITVPHVRYGCYVTLTVGGTAIWSDGIPENQAVAPPKTGSIIVFMRPGESLQQAADRKLGGQRPDYIACPPAYLYKDGELPIGRIQRDGNITRQSLPR